MTTPNQSPESSPPFEQQLSQLRPAPVSGLEAMLYQAGWQAGRAAAAASESSDTKTLNGSSLRTRHRSWIGFASGAASGLAAASLLLVAAASSGWWPNSTGLGSVGPSEQLAGKIEPSRASLAAVTTEQAVPATIASTERGRGSAAFNLLDWFGANTGNLSPAITSRQSPVLTTAPLKSNDFDRLVSVSPSLHGSEFPSLDTPRGAGRPTAEMLRYRPGRSDFSDLRF